MRWMSKAAALLLTASVVVLLSGLFGSVWSVVTVVAGLGAGWWLIPRFWPALGAGALGGALAGLVVLGPGLRVAMRVVAVVDPTRGPEFTLEGTMFIVVIVGGMMGAIIGAVSGALRSGFEVRWPVAWPIPGVMVMAMIVADSGLREELLELGAGPWMNVPMFSAVAGAYGFAAMTMAARLGSRKAAKTAMEVPA